MSSKKSDLRRSNSSSCLPRLSRLPVRNSYIPKNRQRSGSLPRPSMNTPLSRSCRKSPLMSSNRKDTRPIVDKQWQYQQLVKVRNFVSDNFTNLDFNNIKSGIPLELFVTLMDSFFHLIDKRLTITRENYIEWVPIHLKRLHYPTNVKPSLMKTVNTPHSWPHVLAIMSWLTDVICEIKEPVTVASELEMIVDDWVGCKLLEYLSNPNGSIDAVECVSSLQMKLKDFVNTDENEINNLDAEIAKLHSEINSYVDLKNCKKEAIEVLETNIKSINEKCDLYTKESEILENQIIEGHGKFVKKITKIDQELNALHKSEEDAKAIVSSQPHSFDEKQQLAQQIHRLKNTVELIEERLRQQRELVSTCDFQLSDIKQQMEANAYRYNNVINQLVVIDPKYKDLHIREGGFAKSDTVEEIKDTNKTLQELIRKLQQTVEVDDKIKEELVQQHKQIDAELARLQKEEEDTSKADAEINIIHAYDIQKNEKEREKQSAEIKKYQNKLLSLKTSRYDISPLKEELEQTEIALKEHLAFKEDLEGKAVDFFLKLEILMGNNLEAYMKIMENITAGIIRAQDEAIEAAQERIQNLKQLREDVEGKNPKGD